jgi:Cft2 family RNA processing exonuclease
VKRISPRRTAYISGWAVERGACLRLGCDAAFALSDHADFDELLRYVERSAAQQVYTLFGFAEDLAHQLRRRGIRAEALAASRQLELGLG